MRIMLLLLLLLPMTASAETLAEGVSQVIGGLDLSSLESTLVVSDPFEATGGFRQTLGAIARGEITLDLDSVLKLLGDGMLSAIRASLWRLTRIMAPALVWSMLRRVTGRSGEAGRIVCQLCVCVFLTRDLTDHISLATTAIERMNGGMQALFPLLLTMMSAVGGSSGSAIMQPAIVAAASTMTNLLREVTVPLATASAILIMLCHLGEGMKLHRLAEFMQSCASWSLGICFTVFIGVLTTRTVTAASLDGVTLRTAKYAISHSIPVVGGLFADTVDTLVGSGMLVQGALGVTGLMIIAGYAMAPLCQTLAAALLYRLASALMQPVSEGPLAGCIHDFGRVLMLLFIMQLCAAAMFLMLIAQMITVSGLTMMLR